MLKGAAGCFEQAAVIAASAAIASPIGLVFMGGLYRPFCDMTNTLTCPRTIRRAEISSVGCWACAVNHRHETHRAEVMTMHLAVLLAYQQESLDLATRPHGHDEPSRIAQLRY